MDFGKVPVQDLSAIDFKLPPDGERTNEIFSKVHQTSETRFHLGCPKWGRKEWRGLVYPKATTEADFLGEYVKIFNSIELNGVFYSIPPSDLIKKWRKVAEENGSQDFLFCPKMCRTVTHIKRLQNCEGDLNQYLESIRKFKGHLGPIFFQLSDNFPPSQYLVLESFVELLPTDLKFFVEIRHKDWFNNPIAWQQVTGLLKEHQIGLVISDTSGRRDVIHMDLTIPEVFIRFVGNGAEFRESDFTRIDDWVIRLKNWQNRGLEQVYFFTHQHNEMDTPILANYAIQQFNQHLGASLKEVKFL